jgi:murein L,D-transpeptidase YafK
LIKNILYIAGSVIIFFFGMILYGVILNFRENTLDEEMRAKKITAIQKPVLIVNKKNYTLGLYDDTVLVKTYKAAFGKSSRVIKESFIDNVTPTGEYSICYIDSASRYHRNFLLNYPNQIDVVEAYKKQWITKDEYYQILKNISRNSYPFDGFERFSKISIHGIGEYNFIFRNLPFTFNWTNGSIALSNANIDELFHLVKVGTPVLIKE